MSIYIDKGKMNIVKIYPDSVLSGLIRIGGILGLIGLVVTLSRMINYNRMVNRLDDKIWEMKTKRQMTI